MSTAAKSAPTRAYRAAEPDEVVLVEASWKQSFWRESTWARRISWQVFSRGHQKVIWRLLAQSQLLVAYDTARPDQQLGLGYIVFEPDALHYLWVREPERGKGVARFLFEASGLALDLDGVSITHATAAWFGPRALADRFPKSIHDPYRWMEV